MKELIRRLALLALAGVFTIIISGSVFAAEPFAANQKPLRVGVAPTMAPMIFKEGKNIVGIEADLAQAVGRELGRSITFVELRWPDLLDALETDKIDIIMSSMSVTPARQTRALFAEPYFRIGQMALIRGDGGPSLFGTALANKNVGVKKGTTADLLVQQEFPRATRKYYDSGEEAAKALSKHKIDLYFSDSTVVWYLAGKFEAQGLIAAPMAFTNENLAWAVRRSDPELLKSVNQALKQLIASGELNRALTRWIPRFQ